MMNLRLGTALGLCFGLSLATPALAADPAPPAEALPPAPPAPPAVRAEGEAPPPPAPQKLAVGDEGTLQLGMLVQAWTVFQQQNLPKTGDDKQFFFRVRRAEIKLNANLVPDLVTATVMIDPARALDDTQTVAVTDAAGAETPYTVPKTKTSILQDAYITFQSSVADVSVGQFKIPISWEGYNSASKIILPERAASSVLFGDKRDLGLKVEKGFGKYDKNRGYAFKYWVGLYSGEGQNISESTSGNDRKDVALRLEVMPTDFVMVGGATLVSVGQRELLGSHDRYEGDLRLTPGDFLLQGEFIAARDRVADGAGTRIKRGQGFYAAVGYTLAKKYQPVARVGQVDPDTQSSSADASGRGKDEKFMSYELGLNYLLRKDVKLQLAGGRNVYDHAEPASYAMVAAQASF